MLETTRNKKKKNNEIVMLARSILKNKESETSKALINNETGHEDFMTIINDEKNYPELKGRIKKIKSQRKDAKKINLIEKGKKKVLMKLLNTMKLLTIV